MRKPKTLKECWEVLNQELDKEDIDYIKNLKKDGVVRTHHTLGRWIRNNWGLWAGSDLKVHLEAIGFTHPDDMSSVIINSYWAQLNNQYFDLDEKVKYYQDYWKRTVNET